jgi:serine/threonine protein kinase
MSDATGAKPAAATERTDLTGRTVDRFLIEARLGAGGMGEVYRASDQLLKRTVALKRIAPELREDPYYRRRFFEEAERASKLSDPHVAHIHDVIEEHGDIFLVMEYVEGATLRALIGRPLPVEEFLPIAVECAEALVAAHAEKLLHCDIKPENIIRTPAGKVKILDFGVARPLISQDDAESSSTTADKTVEHFGGTMLPKSCSRGAGTPAPTCGRSASYSTNSLPAFIPFARKRPSPPWTAFCTNSLSPSPL